MNKTLLFLLVVVMTLACACSISNQKPKPTPAVIIYEVTKSTGLYDAPNLDANMIGDLSEGQLLKPVDNQRFYDCENIVEDGVNYSLCHVEVIASHDEGWVLQKWTKRHGP
jgi:hypothetical protein